MKKNLLTLGIAAAVGGLGLVSPALAQEQATSLKISPTGKGHILIVPYYTVQSGNATLLNIVNSDKVNGKAVKLRFRGAAARVITYKEKSRKKASFTQIMCTFAQEIPTFLGKHGWLSLRAAPP